jgi:prepilin-type N-terminal cleavage/methylation domain-containing protein
MKTGFRKVLKNREGFTLVELITVIILLGVILGIGVPKYATLQAQSEWDADLATLQSMEKAAEIWYALYKDRPGADATVDIDELHDDQLFDKNTKLKRLRMAAGTKSERRTTSLDAVNSQIGVFPTVTIDPATGNTVWEDDDINFGGDGVNDWINEIIGLRPPKGVASI